MTSADDVHRLHGEGLSIRAIANRLGLSRMKVHRTLTDSRKGTADDWGDDEDGGLALVSADADYPPPPPYTYVGTELVALESRDMDSQLVEEDRWLDGNGHSCSMLDIYRWCAYREGDDGDYAGAARVRADVQRQLDVAGASSRSE
jgi:hypothetical protein